MLVIEVKVPKIQIVIFYQNNQGGGRGGRGGIDRGSGQQCNYSEQIHCYNCQQCGQECSNLTVLHVNGRQLLVSFQQVDVVVECQGTTLISATVHLNDSSGIIPGKGTNGHSAGITCQSFQDPSEGAIEPSCDNE